MRSQGIAGAEFHLSDLRQLLDHNRSNIYALVDACDEPLVPSWIESLEKDRATCLYSGRSCVDYWAIAPYLVRVDDQVISWIEVNLWASYWGYFISASVDLKQLRQHLRKFLTVQDTDGSPMYFRFYDPRVIPVFLSSCSQTEMTDFFGPIDCIYCIKDSASRRYLRPS